MTDTILSQVTDQVKKAIGAANFARPPPIFDYVPTTGCGPSHRHVPIRSCHHSDEVRERLCPNGLHAICYSFPAYCLEQTSKLEGKPLEGDTLLSITRPRSVLAALLQGRPQPMTTAARPHNTRKYYEFHEQNGHTTAECRELRRALHELADKRQIGPS
ncbi:hypothetical protein Cgig2_017720 [Carnegiea gigantea]|uniref:Uncharacterized protein n=1 Tax=Carnegiea gigantea TaxID=171969 RepID=A0A9Q1GQ07_9CARY|nr:hypothetical protein Cgig2_017720 [Carnegiea gigantea]